MTFEAWIAYGFTVLLVIAAIAIKNSRTLYVLQIMWMIILIGFNTFSQDYTINETLYNIAGDNDEFSILGFAYYITVAFAKNSGLDFLAYNFITSTISIIIIGYIVKKYAKNYNLAFSLIYLYPFAEMIIQKRFLPAMAISLVALQYLNQYNWKAQCKFLVLITLATGFHSAVIFYLIFWLLDWYTRKGFTKGKIALLTFLWGLMCVASSFIPSIAGLIFPADKIELYFTTYAEKSNVFHFLFWAVLHASVVWLVYIIYKKTPRTKYSTWIFRLNIYSLFVIPLYNFDPVFMRYFRAVLIYDYIYLGDFFPRHLVTTKTALKGGLCIVLIGILYSTVWYYLGIGNQTFERMIAPIFNDNVFISWL